jgi:hypothetical protein
MCRRYSSGVKDILCAVDPRLPPYHGAEQRDPAYSQRQDLLSGLRQALCDPFLGQWLRINARNLSSGARHEQPRSQRGR